MSEATEQVPQDEPTVEAATATTAEAAPEEGSGNGERSITDRLFGCASATGKWMNLVDALLTGKPLTDFFTRQSAEDLCSDACSVLKAEPSLLELNIESSDVLTVCGDVHGQFGDLIHHMLSTKRAGEAKRKFLFLGDYVDRGPQGVEVIMMLLALKIEFPKSVFLLRGNHEESQTSRIYGFFFEVRTKFSDVAVWARFNEVFCHLPLAALVSGNNGKRFLGVHGGLSPALQSVGAIKDIDRSDYGGMLDNESSSIVDGLLWSDPTVDIPQYRANERGCGYAFGPAATTEFCQDNELEFICRAHQMTMEGFTWTHDKKCLTLFSAPNYCGVSGNLGALMIVMPDLSLDFVQYECVGASGANVPAPNPQGTDYFN